MALSADAVPALDGLGAPYRNCVLERHRELVTAPDSPFGWNLGRSRARAILAERPPRACDEARLLTGTVLP